MRLRSSLILLVVATAIPLAVLAFAASLLLVRQEQQNFIAAIKDRNRAFISAVDAEIQGHINALRALSAVPNLAQDDLARVHADLVAVKASQPGWISIVLHAPDGRQLVNTLVPYGQPVPVPVEPESVRQAAASQQPVVGGMTRRRMPDTFGIPVRVPIVRDGRTVYVLSAILKPDIFDALMEAQHLPGGWVSGLVDAQDRFVARIPAQPRGASASPDYRAAITGLREGWYRGRTVEGLDTFTAFARSTSSGWSVGFALPASVVQAQGFSAVSLMTVIALACLAMAIPVALWLGRLVAQPITMLARVAPDLGQRDITVTTNSRIDEVRQLAHALGRASEAIRQRDQVSALERRLLADADRAKDEFIAMLSHEMRNPLAALMNAAALLKLRTAEDRTTARVQLMVERQTHQLNRLVEDMLDVSRIAMNKLVLALEPLDLGVLVGEELRTWQQAGRAGAHALASELDGVWVRGDRARLAQVVSNLLDNACKFTPKGGRIDVTVAQRDGRAVLRVADSGGGISPEDLPHVFELFVQGAQGLSRSRGGMGLGLALVKRLVEMHGGTASAESDGPGRGAAFTVTLPAIGRSQAQPEAALPLPAPAGSRRILLVEDNDDVRTSLSILLEARGYLVQETGSGTAALELAAAIMPEIVIVDIGLPDLDGYEVARRLRQRETSRTCYLVALTGYGQPEDERNALEAGFDVHVVKPISPADLDALLAARASPFESGLAHRPRYRARDGDGA
jgi:signal transduction histidine kinase/ActR/RegA family two-component response regulator